MIACIHLAEIDSTQDEALRRYLGGTPTPFAVYADVQTMGRGRQGRAWESPPGNLSATTVCSIDPASTPGDYAFIVAVALHAALSPLLRPGTPLHLKWPNDVLLAGQKCAGILLERPEPNLLLIGTGVNIVAAPPDRACVNDHARAPVTAPQMLAAFHTQWIHWLAQYQVGGLPAILAAWRAQAYGLGQDINVRLPKEAFRATFTGLAPDGALIATLPNGEERRVHAGEVFFDV
jgi:BirA family transcriptional regulator, biotin operon repressor / biotin---[acetyl-CoA-carboxylase] ligase